VTKKNIDGRGKTGQLRSPLGTITWILLLIFSGPVLIGVGTYFVDADAELARTGQHVQGTILEFYDVQDASDRSIDVAYQPADGTVRYVSADVDHEQHPAVGEEVTVVYSEQDPGRAVVLGFESSGVQLRGMGVVLTIIFWGIALMALVFRQRRRRSIGISQP
jgi:hypothetical protein